MNKEKGNKLELDKCEDVKKRLIENKSEEIEKFIQRKRKCKTPRNFKTEQDDDEQNSKLHNEVKKSSKSETKSGGKRKNKKGTNEYFVPLRIPFKSSQCLVSLIDKIITKSDPLQILRGYRDKLINLKQFNDFNARKVDKLLNLRNNCENLVFIDFSGRNFNLILNKNENFLEFVKKETESDSVNVDSVSYGNVCSSIEKKTQNINMTFSEKTDDIIESKPPSDLLNRLSTNPLLCEPNTTQLNSENSSNTCINLNLLSDEYYDEIEKKFRDQTLVSEKITDIDILRYKAEMNYYTNIQEFAYDVNVMFSNVYNKLHLLVMSQDITIEAELSSSVCNEVNNMTLTKVYLTAIYIEMTKLIEELKSNYESIYDNDIKVLLDNNKLPRVNITEFRNVPLKKEYQEIKEYEHIFPDVTKSKTASCLMPQCKQNCCERYEDIGPLNLEKSKWDSKCEDRSMNIECNPDICGCNKETCKNMDILMKNNKTLGKDVVEKYAWGIDLYTYRNLIEFLPLNFSDEFKSKHFIENTLIKACCDMDVKGYSLKKACKLITYGEAKDNFEKYQQVEIFFASHLLKVFRYSRYAKKNSSHAYSKGIGIFCLKKEGIHKNELIAPYLGEIYPPWYWYEKQDLIKKNKLDKVLPDFYNIMLERHKTDTRGYDLVMVDPNSKGNFASRMSHSCHPNCNTVLMSSGNDYTIGMYATENISYGQELTFDYNSVTEKEKEFQDAICLCSSFNCRGHYLIYSNSNLFTELLSDYHTFLHRNSILLQACDLNYETNSLSELTDQDKTLLDKYAIRLSILANAPFWLKKWAALILRYVDFESKQLPIILYENSKNSRNEENEHRAKKQEEKNLGESGKDMEFCLNQEKYLDENKINNNKNITQIELNSDINDCSNLQSTKDKSSRIQEQRQAKRKFDFNSNFIFPGVKKYESSRRKAGVISKTRNTDTNLNLSLEQENKIEIEENQIHESEAKLNKISKINEEQLPYQQSLAVDIILENTHVNDVIELKSFVNHHNEDYHKVLLNPIQNSHLKMIITNEPIAPEVNQIPIDDNDTKEFINQVAAITENRIQNIAITIDKVIHVLKLMNTNKPPLIIISEKEIYEHYWGRTDSIRENLYQNFKNVLKSADFRTISNELTEQIENIIDILKINYVTSTSHSSEHYAVFNSKVRDNLKEISYHCRNCIKLDKSQKFIFYEGLADILYLYSCSKTYFKHDNSYGAGAESELSYIRRRDICTTSAGEDLDEAIHKDRKHYDKLYIWGQLVGWYKQTVRIILKYFKQVDKPNASLSAERRGTLSYPEVDSFFTNFDNFGKKSKNELFKYPLNTRKNFFNKILENPSQMWPVGNLWSYKNKKKIYGSVQFDSVILSQNPFDVNETKSHIRRIFDNLNLNNTS